MRLDARLGPARHRLSRLPRLHRWAVFGALLGLLSALLWAAPALWLAQGVSTLSQGRVQLHAPMGTFWAGSAQWAFHESASSKSVNLLPGRVSWRLQPSLGGLRMALEWPCCPGQAWQLELSATRVSLAGSAASSEPQLGWQLRLQAPPTTWPAEILMGLGAPWNTIQAQGTLEFSASHLELQAPLFGDVGMQSTGQAQLLALDMRSRLSTLHPLGSYRLLWQAGSGAGSGGLANGQTLGSAAPLVLSTLSGPLQLQGQGHWHTGRFQFEGMAQTDAEHEAVLSNLLALLGRRQGLQSTLRWGS